MAMMPSEYVRELIRQDKERRLGNLERELVAAAADEKASARFQRCGHRRHQRRVSIDGFPKHLLFCRFDHEEVFVLRGVHGERDLEHLFHRKQGRPMPTPTASHCTSNGASPPN